MKTIVCLHNLSDDHLRQIRETAPGWDVVSGKDKELWRRRLSAAEIIVGWHALAGELALGPDSPLRWVQSWGAGVDWLPLAAFSRRRIMLTNASGVHAFPISETIFAMMLAFARKLHTAMQHQMNKKWESIGSLHEIHGRTAGIIGIGAIGEETARLAKAFGMHVLGVRRSGEPSPYVDRMYDIGGLAEVLKQSDYVIVTLPLTGETRGLFSREQFRFMKQTAYFINIGRGGTTDTAALIDALKRGEIAGAGLDVFEQEPLPDTSPLWEMENVIITPHNSGSTVCYETRAMDIFLRNLRSYLEGGEPRVNRVDLTREY